MKAMKILSVAAIAGIMATGTAMAQSSSTTTYSQSYVQQQGAKHTSSRAEYRPTHLRPYNGEATPYSDD